MADGGGTVNPNPSVGAVWIYYGATLGGGWSLDPIDTSAGVVVSFNGRNGEVELLLADVTAAGGAPISSPSLSGVPTAPTAAPGTNTLQLATTAFVTDALTAVTGGITAVIAGAGLNGGGTSGNVTLNLNVPVTIANGGTGATTVDGAHTNLNFVSRQGDTMTGDLLIVPGDGSSARFDVTTGWSQLTVSGSGSELIGIGQGTNRDGYVWTSSAARHLYLNSDGGDVIISGPGDVDLARFSTTSVDLLRNATAPTPATGDSSTRIATTAFVKAQGYQTANATITLTGDITGSGTTSIVTTYAGTVPINRGGTNATTAPLALDSLSGASGATAGVLSRSSGGVWSVTAGGGVTSITAGAGITATPNPITGTGTIALSTPVTVGNGGTGLSSLTSGAILVGNAGAAVNLATLSNLIDTMVGTPATGQILQRNSSGFWGSLAPGSSGQVLMANGAGAQLTWGSAGGSVSITAGAGITVTPSPLTGTGTIALTTPVTVANGGTGLSSLTLNNILVGNGTSAVQLVTLSNLIDSQLAGGAGVRGQILWRTGTGFWGVLAAGTAGQYLRTGGTAGNATWAAPNLASEITGTLPIANGGTNLTAYAQGDIIYASATNVLSALAKDANATRYLSNTGASNAPAWAQVNVANGITGVLPVANGGTGASTAAAAPWVEVAGETMSGRLAISFADPNPATTNQFLVAGTSKGVRIFTDSAKTNIEGVDQTGIGPYNPLAIGGSMIQMTVSNVEKARVDSSGISTSGSMTITGSGGNAVLFMNGGRNWYQLVDVAANNGIFGIVDATAGAFRLTIDQTGGCKNTSGTWSAISDERLKRNITPYEQGLAQIVRLRPARFYWNGEDMPDHGEQQIGLIAQQVERIFPEVVGESNLRPGGEEPLVRKTVDPGKLIYACINAIKELHAEVERLEADVAELRRH